jgi:hypothetical protein
MDNTILRKKLSTFKSPKGNLIGVSPEVLYELLKAWEGWDGPSREFYQSIGVNRRQAARILGKAKQMSRQGAFPAEEFKEISLSPAGVGSGGLPPCNGIELCWEQGKVIRFPQVDQLLEFLKKAA